MVRHRVLIGFVFMPDPQALQLALFSGGLALTASVLLLAFRRTDQVERERTGRRRMRRRLNRMLRLPPD